MNTTTSRAAEKIDSVIVPEQQQQRKKRRRVSAVSGKVCIVVCVCSGKGVYDDYNIYILDPSTESQDGFALRPPTLRFDWNTFQVHAFCVLDSTLFVFEQTRDLINPEGKSAFSYDLSTIDVSKVFDRRLEKRNLTQRRPMNYPKRFPAAVPTPDGKKILVYSTMINYNGVLGYHVPYYQVHHDVADEIDFELYDPAHDSWEILPGLPHNYDRDAFLVRTVTFVNNSTFLVETDIGKFTLDLGDHKSGWKPASNNKYATLGERPKVISIEDDLAFTSSGAYDMKKSNPLSTLSRFPLAYDLSSAENYFKKTSSGVTLLDDGVESGTINLCVAETAVKKGTKWPHMFVDVLSIDANKYKELEKEEELEARNVRAFRFLLHDKPCSVLYICAIFYTRSI